MPEQRQDPQDKQFGAQARRDADVAEQLDREVSDVSDRQGAAPRAGAKAEPVVDCVSHDGHVHEHAEGCGHEAVDHDSHTDYVHDGHRHAAHAGHWDEH